MAVLNKLRNSSWVLILVLLSLVLFVVSDYFSSNNRLGFDGSQNVGTIAGTDITLIEFDAKYRELLAQLKANGSGETDQTKEQASNFAWNQYIQSLIVDKEFEKLGIEISVDESGKLLYSADAHATIKQYFTNENGEFNPSNVLNFKNKTAKKDPKAMAQFELILKQVFIEVQSRKYSSMVSKSLYATSLDAEDDFYSNAANYTGKSIMLNFASIDDKTIKITDDELKTYINNHKEQFKQKASRDLEYVLINVAATKDDTLAIKEELLLEKQNFATADDDTAFVNLNSAVPYSNLYQSHGSYRKEFENDLFKAPKDSIIGPFYYEGGFSIFKVLDKKTDSVYYFHAIKAEVAIRGTTKLDTADAMALGRKLGQESNSSSDALEFFNSKASTGDITYAQDLGWMREGTQTPEINDAIKTLSSGQSTVVKSVYGISIIKLIEPKSSDLIKVAEFRKMVLPLKATEDAAYQKASDFRAALVSGKEDEFETMSKKFNLTKSIANNVKESDKTMTGLPGTLDVVRWSFNKDREAGDYSDVIATEDMLIVAHLKKIKKEGTSEVDDVREQVTRLVMNDKKAEILKKQLEDASKKAKSIEEIAIAVKTIAQPFSNVNFYANNVQFAGNDPKLVGFVCGLKPNVLSKPFVTSFGVHLIYVEKIDKPELPKEVDARKGMIYQQKKQQAYNSVFEALKKAADLKDERYKFY